MTQFTVYKTINISVFFLFSLFFYESSAIGKRLDNVTTVSTYLIPHTSYYLSSVTLVKAATMEYHVPEPQWSKCLDNCELCALSPEDFKEYLVDNQGSTLRCVRLSARPMLFFKDGQRYVSGVAVRGNDRHADTATISDPIERETCRPVENAEDVVATSMSECETCSPVDNEESVEAASMSKDNVGSGDDSEDDAWSVVSESDSIVLYNQRLLCDDDDQADEESDVEKDDQDADDSDVEDAVDQEDAEDEEESEDAEKRLDDNTSEQDEYLNSDNEEDETLDDYTEEGIRLAEALEVQALYREELEELRRQHQDERKHAEWRYHQMEVRTRDLHQEIEIRVEEGWRRESDYKKRHREELDGMQRMHDQRLEQIKLKLTQENYEILKSLEVSQERRRQDAANSAKLSAEAANTLSAEIQEVIKLKTTLENTKSAYSSQTARNHKELRLLQNRLEAALIKEQNDHSTHLTTRNQLAKVEHEMDKDRKNFKHLHQQAMIASKEALQRQHETHLGAVRQSYEQELEKLKEEHEQDKAHNDGHVCELEAELDALCQERDEQYQRNCDLRERFEEARFDTEYELEEADQKLECLEQILSDTSCELQGVKDEKTQLDEEMVELQATMEELCQQAQDNKVKHKQDMDKAIGHRQELEAAVSSLLSQLGTANQGNTELRDQLKEVKVKEQEMEKREQQLLSQSTADRLMFERTAHALRSLLKKS
jgi:hypothetical protein